MNLKWNNEWNAPALIGAASFVAGVAIGAVGYRIKIDREIEANLVEMMNSQREPIGKITEVVAQDNGIVVSGVINQDAAEKWGLYPEAKDLECLNIPVSDDIPIITSDEVEACQIQNLDNELMKEVVDGQEEQGEEPDPRRNVFESTDSWDWKAEETRREQLPANAPFIIHEVEYYEDETGYRKHSCTYFVGDDILVDEAQVPIYDHNSVVGEMKFGRGTNDPNTTYIRNPGLRAEYEIVRHPGHYQIEVMGLHAEEEVDEDELKHSNRILRFRAD